MTQEIVHLVPTMENQTNKHGAHEYNCTNYPSPTALAKGDHGFTFDATALQWINNVSHTHTILRKHTSPTAG